MIRFLLATVAVAMLLAVCVACGSAPPDPALGPDIPVAKPAPAPTEAELAAAAVTGIYECEKNSDWAGFAARLSEAYVGALAEQAGVTPDNMRETIFPGMMEMQHRGMKLTGCAILEQKKLADGSYSLFVQCDYAPNEGEPFVDAHYAWAVPEKGGWKVGFAGEFEVPAAARAAAETYLDHFVAGRSREMYDMLAPGYLEQVLESCGMDREEYFKDFDLIIRKAINLKENLRYEIVSARCERPKHVIFTTRIQYTKLGETADVTEEYDFIEVDGVWRAILPMK